MIVRATRLLPWVCLAATLAAGELAPTTEAKFVRVITVASGGGKVECANKEIAGELTSLGLALDPEAKVAWADTDKDVVRLAKLGRLVICGNVDWLAQGAAVAIVAEGGRPSISISLRALANAGVSLPDAVLKISKVQK